MQPHKTWMEEMQEKLQKARTSFVAWDTMFGDVFAGRIVDAPYDTAHVERIDGGHCNVAKNKLRPASQEDLIQAFRSLAGIELFNK